MLLAVGAAALACLQIAGTVIAVIAPDYIALFFAAVLLRVVGANNLNSNHALRSRFLTVPGKYCYFLYLFHFTILGDVGSVVHNWILVRILSMGLLLLAAFASWTLFESPCIQLGHRWRYGRNAFEGNRVSSFPTV